MPRRGENVKQLANGRWQASYRKLDGKEAAKTFDRQVDARRWRREGLAAKDRGEFIDPKLGRASVREFGEQHRQAQLHHRPGTKLRLEHVLRRHVYPHIGDRPVNRILRSDVQAVVKRWVEDGAAPSTVKQRYADVATIFRAAVKDDLIRKSPCDGIKLPEIPRRDVKTLTAEEVRALADEINPRSRAVILLAYGCGLRLGEALGLIESNVSWLTGEINVAQQLTDRPPYVLAPLKNSRRCPSRIAPMPRYVHEALSRHIELYGLGEWGLIFTRLRGGPMPRGGLTGLPFRAACRQVGLPDSVTFHTLRHSYATEAIARGISETDVAELIGDSVEMVHKVYGHPSADFKKRARLALEAAWAEPAAVADSSRTANLAQVRDLR
jgi:integrase